MRLEDQVVSLELAKRLKELNVKQESQFYWTAIPGNDWILNFIEIGIPVAEHYSAFTVAELGFLLPRKVTTDDDPEWYYYQQSEGVGGLTIGYWSPSGKSIGGALTSFIDSEANMRTKMLIYLLENKLTNIHDKT
jgi:hypothetical protein